MKEIPIIMSGNHPKLILDGVKTMTRRTWGIEVVNQFPDDWQFIRMEGDLAVFRLLRKHFGHVVAPHSCARIIRGEGPNLEFLYKCPYGQVGDRLWVRETWMPLTHIIDSGKALILYKADGLKKWVTCSEEEWEKVYYQSRTRVDTWRPSIHMPRWASRILLEITELRAERLQEMTLQDIRAEGVWAYPKFIDSAVNHKRVAFAEFWDSLNAKRGHSWDKNDCVWPIGFRRIEQ